MNYRHFSTWAFCAPILIPFIMPLSALATPQVDQSFLWTSPGVQQVASASFGFSSLSFGQTFSVGVGGRLTGVDLVVNQASNAGTTTIELRSTSGGVPQVGNPNLLSSVSLSAQSFPTSAISLTHIDFPQGGVPVLAGQTLSLDVISTTQQLVSYDGSPTDLYTGGTLYEQQNNGSWQLPPAQFGGNPDMFFQSYVQVPEPASFGILGLTALICIRKPRNAN